MKSASFMSHQNIIMVSYLRDVRICNIYGHVFGCKVPFIFDHANLTTDMYTFRKKPFYLWHSGHTFHSVKLFRKYIYLGNGNLNFLLSKQCPIVIYIDNFVLSLQDPAWDNLQNKHKKKIEVSNLKSSTSTQAVIWQPHFPLPKSFSLQRELVGTKAFLALLTYELMAEDPKWEEKAYYSWTTKRDNSSS